MKKMLMMLALLLGLMMVLPACAEDAAASLTVVVYNDRNNNGARNAWDPGVPNVTISLLTEAGGEAVASAVTGEEGEVVFEGLAAGDYIVKAELPVNRGFSKTGTVRAENSKNIMAYSTDPVQESPVLQVAEGEKKVAAIGVTKLAAVTGRAWADLNGDGIMQDDEPGQAGVHILLKGTNNGLQYELTTDERGDYAINQVKPGNYKMIVTTPEGTMFTKYSKTGGAKRSYITTEGKRTDSRGFLLEAGQVFENRHIGVVGDATIQVKCFLDMNYNGLLDEGEPMLPDVKVLVEKANGTDMATVYSNADGIASVSALRAGKYNISAVVPEGYTFTAAAEGGNRFASNNLKRKQVLENVEIGVNGETELLAGAVKFASVSGVGYLDDDFSGAMEKGEEVVSGLIIALLDENGERIAVDRTTVKGAYRFENLLPGTYALRLEAKHGYAFTKAGEGNAFLNMGDGKGQTEPFTLGVGEDKTGMDIGQILPGTVQGHVFMDVNDNGLQDAGETGFAGATVRLMGEEGEFFSAAIGEDGGFCFDAVMPGRYFLRYELPGHSTFAAVTAGGNAIPGEGSVTDGQWFDFKVGDVVEAPLCGGLMLGYVTGTAFADHNGNGVMDADEAPMAGLTLRLTPDRADLEPVEVTAGEDGTLAVMGLHPATWQVTMDAPEGYVISRTDGLSLPVEPGKASQSFVLPISLGEHWPNQMLGAVQPASISGGAWLDENVDGLFAEDELKPAGETVQVIDQYNGEVFATLTIGEDGAFAAEGLIPGSYTLMHGPAIAGKSGDSTFTYEDGQMVMRDVQVAEGERKSDLLLGVVCHTSLGGQVWLDKGGEIAALPGAELSLLDGTGAVLAQALSDEHGAYRFDGLMPGSYRIAATLPEGQLVVEPEDERIVSGGNISVMQTLDGRSGVSGVIELSMSRDQLTLNVGAVLPGTLGDLCWLDENGNGLQDTGEGGIPHMKIQLVRNDEVVAETVTDQYGFYRFDDVYPAAYTLVADMPAQVKPTQMRTDIPMIVSVLEADGVSLPVQVVSDQANRNADLGFVLVSEGDYPAGYGQGASQDWTKKEND